MRNFRVLVRPSADELMFHPFLWYSYKRIHFLCEFSWRAKKEAKNSSLIQAILKSNAYEVLDPGWGSRINHLTRGCENDIFQVSLLYASVVLIFLC
ncbi:hypothetical protein PanWU01x14_164160 [Parasponia andersonii]|uniref:Uncharacterized protein n=1 Tax=Parasponia andersonii TaxID=3476 RepID=A0A2P5CD01_PARAD|nr:hypothetical protein PanWU01x14_164160 [Parasponia andersonii]